MLARSVVAALSLSACAAVASADVVILDVNATADNQFTAFIGTSPTVQGAAFLSGTNWQATSTGSFTFVTAGTYYLQIFAEDFGPPDMLLGRFTLSSNQGFFSNGTQELLTGLNGWQTSITGFGNNGVAPIVLGPNGTGPWGNFPAMGAAEYIWHPSQQPQTYYWTTITIVPTPGAASIVALGGLVMARRRRA